MLYEPYPSSTDDQVASTTIYLQLTANKGRTVNQAKKPMTISLAIVFFFTGFLASSASAAITAFRPPPLSEELGCSPTLSKLLGRPDGFFFDPLNLATDENFARFREAELKHGRICMAAFVGLTLPPMGEVMMSMTIPSAATTGDTSRGDLNHVFSASIIENWTSLSPLQFLNIVVTCGFLEAFIFFQRDPLDMPGDYGTGYFGVRDKGMNERALFCELENGRLAMIAFAGKLAAEAVYVSSSPSFSWWAPLDGKLPVIPQLVGGIDDFLSSLIQGPIL